MSSTIPDIRKKIVLTSVRERLEGLDARTAKSLELYETVKGTWDIVWSKNKKCGNIRDTIEPQFMEFGHSLYSLKGATIMSLHDLTNSEQEIQGAFDEYHDYARETFENSFKRSPELASQPAAMSSTIPDIRKKIVLTSVRERLEGLDARTAKSLELYETVKGTWDIVWSKNKKCGNIRDTIEPQFMEFGHSLYSLKGATIRSLHDLTNSEQEIQGAFDEYHDYARETFGDRFRNNFKRSLAELDEANEFIKALVEEVDAQKLENDKLRASSIQIQEESLVYKAKWEHAEEKIKALEEALDVVKYEKDQLRTSSVQIQEEALVYKAKWEHAEEKIKALEVVNALKHSVQIQEEANEHVCQQISTNAVDSSPQVCQQTSENGMRDDSSSGVKRKRNISGSTETNEVLMEEICGAIFEPKRAKKATKSRRADVAQTGPHRYFLRSSVSKDGAAGTRRSVSEDETSSRLKKSTRKGGKSTRSKANTRASRSNATSCAAPSSKNKENASSPLLFGNDEGLVDVTINLSSLERRRRCSKRRHDYAVTLDIDLVDIEVGLDSHDKRSKRRRQEA